MRIGSGVQVNWTLDQGLGTLDLFGEFEEAEEEKGLVRGGASGAVDFEAGEVGEDVHHGTLIQRKICLQPSDLMDNFRTCPENQILSKNLKNVLFGSKWGF
jgi:hypothetical protein